MEQSREVALEPGGRKGLSRRTVVKGVAWAAPAVALAAPAPAWAAVSNCPDQPGSYYVIMYSPPGSNNTLVDRDPTGTGHGQITNGNCTTQPPATTCNPTGGYTHVKASNIGLNVSGINVSHNINQQNTGAVTFSLNQDSCCTISRVVASIHRYGNPTGNEVSGDCPSDYCQQATNVNTYFPISAGGYGTKSVTVNPSRTASLCNGNGVHWGSPNTDCDCQSSGCSGNGYTNGQPYGYVLIEVECAGSPQR